MSGFQTYTAHHKQNLFFILRSTPLGDSIVDKSPSPEVEPGNGIGFYQDTSNLHSRNQEVGCTMLRAHFQAEAESFKEKQSQDPIASSSPCQEKGAKLVNIDQLISVSQANSINVGQANSITVGR